MIYKKHILTKSDISSQIHLMYIQLAKESIGYRVVVGNDKKTLTWKYHDNFNDI